MLNVLSIDWDYFLNANGAKRLKHLPDIPNENYPTDLQNVIWVSRYAEDEELPKIGFNPVVYDVLDAVGDNIPFCVVCDSHKWIYPYAVRLLRESGETEINLLNIDFHSDYRDDTEKLDCGNWLGILMGERKGHYKWLGWEDSYRDKIPKRLEFTTDITSALHEVSATFWDLVFICRSNMWSPPHLDDDFTDVFQTVVDDCEGEIQKGIWDSRYDDKMKAEIENMRTAIGDFMRGKR